MGSTLFDNTKRMLIHYKNFKAPSSVMDRIGRKGVVVLSNATPRDTGETANSWYYIVTESSKDVYDISWHNSILVNGTPLVILLEYGHTTGTGGHVSGRYFIDPAITKLIPQFKKGVLQEVHR